MYTANFQILKEENISTGEIFTFMPDVQSMQTRTYCCGHMVAYTNVSPFARARNICYGHIKVCVRD